MLNPLLTQTEIQIALQKTQEEQGFSAALSALFDWEYQAGYLTDFKLNDNLRFSYFDPELHIDFKTQINIARSLYCPKPLSGKNIPSLHCPLCFENIGLPGKENLRVFEFDLYGKPFFAQLTPFPLHPKHFVLISKAQTPMTMNHHSIEDMLDFLRLAPGYSVFSNSDVEWAGASILNHHHYQAIENLKLPITEARLIPEFSQLEIGLLDFPIATCRVKSSRPQALIDHGKRIIQHWRSLDPENTCNLALHQAEEQGIPHYFLYIIFRNPRYRTPEHLKAIKSEGVGIIEVCGEGIYPVPQDPAVLHQIEIDGLAILKNIIAGNNPVKRSEFPSLFKQLVAYTHPL